MFFLTELVVKHTAVGNSTLVHDWIHAQFHSKRLHRLKGPVAVVKCLHAHAQTQVIFLPISATCMTGSSSRSHVVCRPHLLLHGINHIGCVVGTLSRIATPKDPVQIVCSEVSLRAEVGVVVIDLQP